MPHGSSTESGSVLTGDVRCARCGYSLGGLSSAMRCPECGASAGDSVGPRALRHSAPRYVRTLAAGAGIASFATIVDQLLGFPVIVATMVVSVLRLPYPAWIESTASAIMTVFAWVGLWGVWLLSTPDPGDPGRDRAGALRRWVRGSLGVHAAGSVALALYEFAGWEEDAAYWVVYAVTFTGIIINYFALLLYLRRVAARIPDEGLARFASRLLWLGPLVSIAGAPVFLLGPFVTVWLEVWLLLRLRRRLLQEWAAMQPAP